MTADCDQVFEVSSVGRLYRKSLSLFAHHLEDENGKTISMDELSVNQKFFVLFVSGTSLTRTSAKRIV
jgi:hypothetical protein